VRLGVGGHRFPAALELIQRGTVYGVIRSLAVTLECRRSGTDFGMQLIEPASLLELRIALGGQDLVYGFVVATANITDELPHYRRIIDRMGGTLSDPGRGS